MPRPLVRVLALLELLQSHGEISGPELARRLAVDERTLRRDIARLEEMGIPVTAERGRYGAYSLVAGFNLPPLLFTEGEALALALGLLAARGLGLGAAANAVASAEAKLERVMPAALQRRVRAIAETVALDSANMRSAGNDAALEALAAAAHAGQRVQLRYEAAAHKGDAGAQGEGQSERAFDPYGLARRGGHWYAVGYCHLREGLRSFRLDRVVTVRPLPVAFSRPAGFDALAHLTRSLAELPRAHAVEVRLRTDLATARRELFGALGVLEPLPRGRVLLRAQCDDLRWFARELARLPFDVEIVKPRGLRTELLRCGARLVAMAGS